MSKEQEATPVEDNHGIAVIGCGHVSMIESLSQFGEVKPAGLA